MDKMGVRILIALAIGATFAVGNYIIGIIAALFFICCFESNVFVGLVIIGPQLGCVGGLIGLIVGFNLANFRRIADSWRQSHWFKAAIIGIILLALLWLVILIGVIVFGNY